MPAANNFFVCLMTLPYFRATGTRVQAGIAMNGRPELCKRDHAKQFHPAHVAAGVFGIFAFILWALFTPELSCPEPKPGVAHIVEQMSTFGTGNNSGYSQSTMGRAYLPQGKREAVECPNVNITIGYNVFIWPPQDWKFLIGSQLQDLADSELHLCAQMVIAVTMPEFVQNHTYMDLQAMMQEAVSFIRSQNAGQNALLIQQHENLYEYPALHSLYQIAMGDADSTVAHNHLFMYFHTNGMVNHGIMTERIDRDIFNATVVPWRGIVQHFLNDDDIRVAGYLPAFEGFIWRNYWWARGDWLKQLEKPPRDPPRQGRWYHEYWISFAPDEEKAKSKVLSTCSCSTDLRVEPGHVRVDPECATWEWTPDRCQPK